MTISVASAAAIIAGAWQGHQWLGSHLDAHFLTTAAAVEISTQIKDISEVAKQAAQAAQETAHALAMHNKMQDLKDARQKLDLLRTELSNTQLWQSANGANDLSRARIRELESQIERTKQYVECLEAERATCYP